MRVPPPIEVLPLMHQNRGIFLDPTRFGSLVKGIFQKKIRKRASEKLSTLLKIW